MIKKLLSIIAVCVFALAFFTFIKPTLFEIARAADIQRLAEPVAEPNLSQFPSMDPNTFVGPIPPSYIYFGRSGLSGLLSWFGVMLGIILPTLISLAIIWFLYSVFKYTIVESEDDKTKAKTQLIWGIVGIFVMVSVWGLVNILQSTFSLDNVMVNAPIIR